MLVNAKLRYFLCLLFYVFLVTRAPLRPIPDGLPEALETIMVFIFTTKFLLIVLIGLWILTLVNLGVLFCSNCYFIPLNVSLNLLRKRAKIDQEPFTSLFLCNLYIAVFLALYKNDVGSAVYFLDDYVVLDSLCFKVILFSIQFCDAVFSLGLDLLHTLLCNYNTWCHNYELSALWIFALLILLSSDVHPNPGPPQSPPELSNGYLSFCNWNLNTISKDNFSRVSLLQAHNTIFKYDIISLCETSLNDSTQVPEGILPGYLYHPLNHPDGRKSGGVGIFYKDTLPLRVRNDLSFSECLVTELSFGRKKFFFTVFYRNPEYKAGSKGFHDFLENFEIMHGKISSEKPFATFFTGDVNGHTQEWYPEGDTNAEGIKLDELFSNLNLSQIINEPTHFFRNDCTPSCIDIILTDEPNLVLDSGVRPSLDPTVKHYITFCKLNFKIPPPPSFKRRIYHYGRAQKEALTRAFQEFPLTEQLRNIPSPTQQVCLLNKTILNIMKNFVPNEEKTFRPSEPPWITKSIKTCLRKHNKIYRNYKRNGFTDEDKIKVEESKSEINVIILDAKEKYLQSQGAELTDPSTGSKKYWKILNTFLNKCKIPRIPPLFENGSFVTDCREKATIFNNYFAKQCTPFLTNSVLPTLAYHTNNRLSHFNITKEEVENILKVLNVNKAHGPDIITAQMIKLCYSEVCEPLQVIFQNILNTGIFPDQWKEANVTPVHKKKDKQTVSNYRPISLLPLFSKVFEKIVFNNLYQFLKENSLITKNQSGFTPGDSGTNQLISLVHDIHKAFDDKSCFEVRSIYLDMSKAFDKVWHEGLLHKLKQNGIDGQLLAFFGSYLSDRKQRVVLNGQASEWAPILSGVPQGSVLGPLLFLVFINDLECGIKSQIKFFADDTSLYSVVKDPLISAAELQHDLNIISEWASQWKMSFNPDPTKPAEEILFSHKTSERNHPPLYFNGIEVKRVSEHKHLGLILDPKLNFAAHLREKSATAKKGIGLMKILRSYLPTKALNLIYKARVRSHFDYCDFIYHTPELETTERNLESERMTDIRLNHQMDKLESLQAQAGRAITGAWKGTNRDKLNEELGWEPLHLRRWFRRLTVFYKIMHGLTPKYLVDPVPPLRRHLYGYNIRNEVHPMSWQTHRFKNSFYPDAVNSWNNIGPDLRQTEKISAFKSAIVGMIIPEEKSIFNIHHKNLRYLYQLRVGLSPLRAHKFRHNFRDTPNDLCVCQSGIESTIHFLLHCPIYDDHREVLMNIVQPIVHGLSNISNDKIMSNILLYGSKALNPIQNKEILNATLVYVQTTGRFTSES